MIRSFLAIEPPEAFRAEIRRLLGELARLRADVKWVRPEGVHLTLKFLGDVPDQLVEVLARDAGRAVVAHPAPTLNLAGLGVFPGPRQPRVIWVGLAGDLTLLADLQRDIETALVSHGFPPENRLFKPHLTLGRVRGPQGRVQLLARLETLQPEAPPFTAREVIFFRSDLKPSGAVYTALHRLPLGG